MLPRTGLVTALVFNVSWLALGSASASDAVKIGLAIADLRNDIFNQIKLSVDKNAKDLGVTVIMVDAKDDAEVQASQIQDLVNQKIQALIYIPAGATAAAMPMKLAKAAGIAVVAVDRNPKDAPGDTFVATDSVAGAKTLGEYACKVTGGAADFDVIESPLHTRHEDDRNKGFTAAMELCPAMIEVDRDWTHQSSADEGFRYAQRALLQDANISLIFGRVDPLAIGAARAVQAAHLDHKVYVIGFDGDLDGLQAVRDGLLDATMTQRTQLIGKLALQSALDLIAGKHVPPEQVQDPVLTTRDNVDLMITNHP